MLHGDIVILLCVQYREISYMIQDREISYMNPEIYLQILTEKFWAQKTKNLGMNLISLIIMKQLI